MQQDPDDAGIRIFLPDEETDDLDDLTTGRNDPDVPERPTLDAVFEHLEAGQSQPHMLVGLSDLTRDQVSEVSQRWPTLPVAMREAIVPRVNELGETRYDLHFGRFLRIALDDASGIVRQHAISGLDIETDEALVPRFLRTLREDENDDVRIQAALSLASYAELGEFGDLDEELTDQLREQLFAVLEDSSEPLALRRRTLEAVSVFSNDPRLVVEIEGMYEDDDSGLRSSAVYAMGRSLNQRWYSMILNEFANDDAEVRYEAARAIGHFGDTSSLPGLVELAKDEDDEVRLAAIAAIGDVGGRAAQRVLQNLADQAGSDAEIDALDEALTEASLYDEDFSLLQEDDQ